MDYLRKNLLGGPKRDSTPAVAREDSPISDIDDTVPGAGIVIDAAIQAVLDARNAGAAAAPIQAEPAANSARGEDVTMTQAGTGIDKVQDQQQNGDEVDELMDDDDNPLMKRREREQGPPTPDVEVAPKGAARAGTTADTGNGGDTSTAASSGNVGDASTITAVIPLPGSIQLARETSLNAGPDPDRETAIQQLKQQLEVTAANINNGASSNLAAVIDLAANGSLAVTGPAVNNGASTSNLAVATIDEGAANTNPDMGRSTAAAAADDDDDMQIVGTNIAPRPPPAAEPPAMTIVMRDPNGYDLRFRCKPYTKLSKLFEAYAARFQCDLNHVRFISQHGVQLPKRDPRFTVASVGLQDEDEIDVMLEQLGGARCHE